MVHPLRLRGLLAAVLTSTALAAAPAAAQVIIPTTPTAQVYGAGALPAGPFWRQSADCYGFNLDLIEFKPPLPGEQYPVPDCGVAPVQAGHAVHYLADGSTLGLTGFYAHDPVLWGDARPLVAGDQFYPFAHYAISQRVLDRQRVAIYNSGGTFLGLDIVAPGVVPMVGQVSNPRELYGPLVQFPVAVEPIMIAHDPVYRKVRVAGGGITEFRFRLRFPRPDGGLRLDRQTYCAIFNGAITDWNHPALTALNGGWLLRDPADPVPAAAWSVPMQIVGHRNESGTTGGFTRHLANVCRGAAFNVFIDGAETLPAAATAVFYDKALPNDPVPGETLGKYTIADGPDGVAKYVDFTADPGFNVGDRITQGRITYLKPSEVLSVSDVYGVNTYGLFNADLLNAAGFFRRPTGQNAAPAFTGLLPPDTSAAGVFNPALPGDRFLPQDWVYNYSFAQPIADPFAPTAYPIVVTANYVGYSCYRSGTVAGVLRTYLNYYETSLPVNDLTTGTLVSASVGPLPSVWRRAIRTVFITNGDGNGLQIARVGLSANCSVAGVVGA